MLAKYSPLIEPANSRTELEYVTAMYREIAKRIASEKPKSERYAPVRMSIREAIMNGCHADQWCLVQLLNCRGNTQVN